MPTEAERLAAIRGRTGGESRPGYFGGLGTGVGAAADWIPKAVEAGIGEGGLMDRAAAQAFAPGVDKIKSKLPIAIGRDLRQGYKEGDQFALPGTPVGSQQINEAIKNLAIQRAAAEGQTRRNAINIRNPFDPRSESPGGPGPRSGTDWSVIDPGTLGKQQGWGPQGAAPGALDNLQALVEGAVARATQPTGLGGLEGEKLRAPRGQGFNALNIDLNAIQNQANALTTTYNDEQAAAAAAAEAERLRLAAAEAERLRLLGLNPGGGPPGPPPGPPGPPPGGPGGPGAPAPVSDTIRSLYGEMSTRDFSDMLRTMMTERETNLKDLNKQSVEQLAASVLRRTGQIGDIKTALETELGILDADRAGVQQGLVDAVALRAQEMQSGTEESLTAAREGLGDQVTDEFEKIAQIVGSQAGSQAASSQDAMARLAQIGDMSARERLAAPAQLAAESELALGDEEFAYTQQLQSNLSEALAGLDAEESERIIGEAMRQENFNVGRDQRMIEALVGDLVRKDTQAWQSGEAQLGRDFQAGESQLGRDFSGDQAQLGRDFSAGQGLLGREFSAEQAVLSRTFSGEQSALSRALQTTEREAGEQYRTKATAIQVAAEADSMRLKQEAATMAAEAEAADDQTAADLYKVDVALWRQMGATERESLRNDWIETQRLAGIGQEAFPMGTMQNLQQKYPKLDPDFFIHVNAMLGIDTLNVEEDAQERRDEYLEGLRTTDAFGAKGLSVAETSMIDTLYAELARDVASVDLRNVREAIDSENTRQRERASAFTR